MCRLVRMDSMSHLPITGVVVVSDPNKAPPNFSVIDKTFDRSEDADLWKDGLFGRRSMRYLCVERSVPDGVKDVLIDISFVNDRDPLPVGFTCVETTQDTGEKALKKRLLCCRWTKPSLTSEAITELIFLPRSSRKPPPGYTLIGETNNMALCYKMGKIVKPVAPVFQPPETGVIQGYSTQPYNMNTMNSSIPYLPRGSSGTGTLGRLSNVSANVNAPIAGISWQLNSRFQTLAQLQNLTIPDIKYKSRSDIEREYNYDFQMEYQAARVEPDRR